MTRTIVHVTTLDQWKSVLDVWFKQGYKWASGKRDHKDSYFTNENSYYLILTVTGDIFRCSEIYSSTFIEYSEFMSQNKEDNKTVGVTNGNFDTDITVNSIKMPTLKRGDLLTIETEKGIETVKVVNEYKKGNDHIIETTSLNEKEDK